MQPCSASYKIASHCVYSPHFSSHSLHIFKPYTVLYSTSVHRNVFRMHRFDSTHFVGPLPILFILRRFEFLNDTFIRSLVNLYLGYTLFSLPHSFFSQFYCIHTVCIRIQCLCYFFIFCSTMVALFLNIFRFF